MKLEGETMALHNSNFSIGGYTNMNMLTGVMAAPQRSLIPGPLPLPLQHSGSIFSTSSLSLGLHSQSGDGQPFRDSAGNFAAAADSCFETAPAPRKEDEATESKSSSENMEGGSGDEPDDINPRPTKKRYHRHTVHQIAEMERVFKECPHPDEKQRQELSRELKLSPRQIKFWFQNKRTQMKALHERQDNSVLRSENEKLKAENLALRDAVRHVSCPNCGGPARLGEMSYEEQQLRIENVKLREEIERITAVAAKYIGRHVAGGNNNNSSSPSGSSGGLEEGGKPFLGSEQSMVANHPSSSSSLWCLSDAEKPACVELAVAAMEELLQLSQVGEPLWVMDPISGFDSIDHEAYVQRFPRGIGPTPPGLQAESSRCTGLVIMNPISLVETLMDANRWAEMFPSIISRVQNVDILSTGIAGTYDGAIQLMYAELQLPSPLVPTRENYFLRYSKRVDDHVWVVVDVSVENLMRGNVVPPSSSSLRCRKRPSGCVIEELPNGYSKVSWVEHVEADNRGVHSLYQYLVSCGMGFGAKRWLCTLQRQCERLATVLSAAAQVDEAAAAAFMMIMPSGEGRRSMLKLAERMTNSFCGGVSASTAHTWVTLAGGGGSGGASASASASASGGGGGGDVRVVIRKSVDEEGVDPSGRPAGIILSAATSIWLPIPPSRVFHFLRDERFRTEWDILSNTGVVEEMFHVAKGQEPGNSVSLLRVNPANANQSNMLILQECCTDESCSLVVYAPVDVAAMSAVLNGGDADCVALLPSGFAILPDGPAAAAGGGGGCLLTVAFQILVDHVPTARLSLGSVATVNKLISNTVARIKTALSVDDASS